MLVALVVKLSVVEMTEVLVTVTALAYFLISSTTSFGAALTSFLMCNTFLYAGTSLNLDNTELSSDWIMTCWVDCLSKVALLRDLVTASTIPRPFFDARNCLGLCELQKSIKCHKLTLVLGLWISYDGRIRFVKRAGNLS